MVQYKSIIRIKSAPRCHICKQSWSLIVKLSCVSTRQLWRMSGTGLLTGKLAWRDIKWDGKFKSVDFHSNLFQETNGDWKLVWSVPDLMQTKTRRTWWKLARCWWKAKKSLTTTDIRTRCNVRVLHEPVNVSRLIFQVLFHSTLPNSSKLARRRRLHERAAFARLGHGFVASNGEGPVSRLF